MGHKLIKLDDLKRFTYFTVSFTVYQVDLQACDSKCAHVSGGAVVFDKPWKEGIESNHDYDTVVSRLEEKALDAYKIIKINHNNRLVLISKVTENQYREMMDFVYMFKRYAKCR